ncbi:hypothetical protein HPY28_21110 [Brevibacillus sp. HB1.2]|uniref:McrC family protein n=1 Tax=Brevibacillus sp. HB1.2 TaxID=2738807 RepID=UPI0015773E20|nr:hypothetical protein [Brevibacillus sp. HB1.2]NTU22826.1 hypothetical protein [Brevibacillus sp. HB1.2]
MIPVISVKEYEAILIGNRFSLEKKMITRSQASLLEKLEREQGKSIFKWGNNQIIPQQWIGVASVANLQVEILPKLSVDDFQNIRRNLLYMLTVAREVPFRVQDLGRYDTQKHTFLECFIKVFIDKLTFAIKAGVIHQYNRVEENVPFLKGKLIVPEHLRKNFYNRSKFYVGYDEYSIQNIPNRILKATIGKLTNISKLSTNKKELQLLNALFSEVDEREFSISDFNLLSLPRTVHQSYKEIFGMCKVFWEDESPNLSSGSSQSFSLLFDMNVIYEKFIQNLLVQYKDKVMDEKSNVLTKRDGTSRFLLKNLQNRGAFRLMPDNCIYNQDEGKIVKIIDTKWKVLDNRKLNFGVSQQDMYQMYAYAREFECSKIVLLYPNSQILPMELPKYYNETFHDRKIEISVKTVNLNYRLPEEIDRLIMELKEIVQI